MMSKWLEDMPVVEPVINLDLPITVKDYLVNLYSSLDGFITMEQLPKVAMVNDTIEFLNDMIAELETASKEKRPAKFLPRGTDENCAMYFGAADSHAIARDFINDFVKAVVVGGELISIFIKCGNCAPNIDITGQWKTHCVVYIMKDRANRILSYDWCTCRLLATVCSADFCIRELSQYIRICGQERRADKTAHLLPTKEALEILEKHKDAWVEGIPLWLVKQLLDDPVKATKFGNAVESMICGACPTAAIFVDRSESLTDKIIGTTLKMCERIGFKDYDIYGPQNETCAPETVSAMLAKSFCFSPRCDVNTDLCVKYNRNRVPIGFEAVCFIDIADENFIDNVIKLANLLGRLHYDDDNEYLRILCGMHLYSLEELESFVDSNFEKKES